MHSSHKNSYLQMATPVDPRIINRCVDKAMGKTVIDPFDKMPPFHRVTSNQPCIPIPNCEVTRRPLGFGRRALPKLYKELGSSNMNVVKEAVTTLCDLMHDPERNYEAIQLGFPAKMADLLIYPEADIRERTLIALTTMGNLLEGKYVVVKHKKMLEKIALCMKDECVAVRMQVYALLQANASVWMAADALVARHFVELLVDSIEERYRTEDKNVLVLMLQTMEQLMYCNGKHMALEYGLYCILLDILAIETNEEVIGSALKCISVLTQTDAGKKLALKTKLLKNYLYKFIFSEIEVIYENALAAMLFATIKMKAVAKAVKLPNLADRLIELAKSKHQPTTQKLCFQILTNLTANGIIKKYVLEERFAELNAINVSQDEHAQRVKQILLVESLKFG